MPSRWLPFLKDSDYIIQRLFFNYYWVGFSFCLENSRNPLHQGTEETENCRLILLSLIAIQGTPRFTGQLQDRLCWRLDLLWAQQTSHLSLDNRDSTLVPSFLIFSLAYNIRCSLHLAVLCGNDHSAWVTQDQYLHLLYWQIEAAAGSHACWVNDLCLCTRHL